MPVNVDQSLARRALIATVMSGALALAVPAQAEIKGLEIIAPAGPGGGYDQLARATQEVLQAKQLASGVQVQNIPGAGGTIGLAQFVTKGSRNPSLLVAGLGLVGAIADQQVAGHARAGGSRWRGSPASISRWWWRRTRRSSRWTTCSPSSRPTPAR